MSGPVLRILLGTRNSAAHLAEQLESYAAQSHANWALWVSDDGSTDDTRAVLERFRAAHPDREIRLLQGPGRGAAANYLSLLTHPELPPEPVALSDHDDVWMPHKLDRAWSMLADLPGPAVYGSTTTETDAALTPLPRQRPGLPPPSFQSALVQNILAGNTTVLNPPALAALRAAGAPEVPFHDWWIYLRLTGVGARVLLDDRPGLYYRQHPGNVIGAHSGLRAGLQRARSLIGGDYRDWLHRNLTALLARPEGLRPDHAEAARTLLTGRPRLRALAASGARRPTRTGQLILQGLALTGRL